MRHSQDDIDHLSDVLPKDEIAQVPDVKRAKRQATTQIHENKQYLIILYTRYVVGYMYGVYPYHHSSGNRRIQRC